MQNLNSRDVKVISLDKVIKFFILFKDRLALWLIEILWLLLLLCYACTMVYSIKRKLYAKNQGHNSRKDTSYMHFDQFSRQTLWLIEVLYAVKRDLQGFIGSLGRLHQKSGA